MTIEAEQFGFFNPRVKTQAQAQQEDGQGQESFAPRSRGGELQNAETTAGVCQRRVGRV